MIETHRKEPASVAADFPVLIVIIFSVDSTQVNAYKMNRSIAHHERCD